MNIDCNDILNNEKLTEIFKSNNTAMQSKLRDCIREKFSNRFFAGVHIYNTSVSSDLLLKAASDIFTESIDKLQTGVYAGTINLATKDFENWLYITFKNAYQNKFISEKKRQQYNKRSAAFNENKTLTNDELSYKVCTILNKIGQPCKDYLIWHYIEDMSMLEISTITGKNADGIKTQLLRCRGYFKELWNPDNTTNKTND